jgi:hypothetical protein
LHTRHLAAITLLVAAASALAPACVATVDSPPTDEPGGPGANMTPAEPVGDAQQALQFCECSTESDWCIYRGKRCVVGTIPCTKVSSGCGTLGHYSCIGWCLD